MKGARKGATVNENNFLYWMAVEDNKPVKFADLPHMMAIAMHPSDAALFDYAAARLNLDDEVPKAVRDGELAARNSAGMGGTHPRGAARYNSP